MLNVIKIKQEQPDLINDSFYNWLSFSRIKDYVNSYESLCNNCDSQISTWVSNTQLDQEWLKYEVYNETNAPRHQIYGVCKDGNFFILEEWYLFTVDARALNVSIEEMGVMSSELHIEVLRQAGYLVDTLAHWCGKTEIMEGYQWRSNKFPSLWDAANHIIRFNYSKSNCSTVIKHLIKNVDKKVYGACLSPIWIDKPIQNFAGINTLIPQTKK